MTSTDVQPGRLATRDNWDINNSAIVNSDNPEEIYKEYDYIRKQCPVAHVDKHNGYWILTRYDTLASCSFGMS